MKSRSLEDERKIFSGRNERVAYLENVSRKICAVNVEFSSYSRLRFGL